MLVRKRYTVQKSFRLDKDVERDLAKLAEITEKSQNDLVSTAIIEMLQDNKVYFLDMAVYEHFMSEIEDGKNKFSAFELGGLKVEIELSDTGTVFVSHTVTENCEVLENYKKEFQDCCSKEFDDYLKNLGQLISSDSKDAKEYLESRTDYRDYIKVRK